MVFRRPPEKDKDDLLVDALSEPVERWRIELLHRFQHENALLSAHVATERRTAENLLTAVCARVDERARKLNAKRAAETAQQKAKDEADRALFLDNLAVRENAI